MSKLQEFIGIVNSKIGEGYVYGGQNSEPLTRESLTALVNKFGRKHYYFSTYSAEKWLGKEYFDCSGLIVYALRKLELISNTADYTAQNIYSMLCTPLTVSQLRTGDLCFNKSSSGIIHVGIYMGNNRVTHARGTFYGVVNTDLFSSFNTFGRLKSLAAYPPVTMIFTSSVKKAIVDTTVYEQPNDMSKSIGKIKSGSSVDVQGIIDYSWYMISINNKLGYVQYSKIGNYDALLEAITFLSQESGISKEYWYKQALNVKWLDACFIKIANRFKENNK